MRSRICCARSRPARSASGPRRSTSRRRSRRRDGHPGRSPASSGGSATTACCAATPPSPDDVARLLDGATPTLLATDPPYGVSLDPTWRDGVYNALGPAERPYMRIDGHLDAENATRAPGGAHGRTAGHRNTTLTGDTRVDWSEAFALVPSLTVGLRLARRGPCGRGGGGPRADRLRDRQPGRSGTRGSSRSGRCWYHWSHEPCWVVRKKGAKVPFRGSRDQATIWRVPSPKMIMGGSTEAKHDHPAQKPLVLFETPIRNHLRAGEAVYDPFLGQAPRSSPPSAPAPAATRWRSTRCTWRWRCARWERFSGQAAERVDG